MAYEARVVQSATANALPTGTDPLVDNTASGDVQAIKILDGTAGSTTPVNIGGGVEANALRVTIANDSTGLVSVDDNGGSLTVDGTVTATIAAGATTIAKAEDGASADADVGAAVMAVRKATPANTSGTDGDYEMLQMSVGRLWTSATIDTALPAGSAIIGALTANQSVNTAQINGVAPLMGNGASGTGAPRVTIANDSTGILAGVTTVTTVTAIGTSVTPGTSAAHLGKAEDAAAASGDTGVAVLGVRRDTPATNVGAAGDYAEVAVSGIGSLWVTPTPNTQGGLSVFHLIGAASTNLTNIKASAGMVYGWFIQNAGAAPIYVKFHNTAGTPTAGSGVIFAIGIPATSGANVEFSMGIPFATGIAISTVTGIADANTTAIAASELNVNLFYK